MKISISFLAIAMYYVMPLPAASGNSFRTHVIFNDDIVDSTKDCNNSEWRTVLAVTSNATDSPRRRQLRTTSSAFVSDDTAFAQRRLPAVSCGSRLSIFIGRACAGKTSSEYVNCDNPDCNRRRRRMNRGLADQQQQVVSLRSRSLQQSNTSTPCDAEMQIVNRTLNTATIPNISSKCRALLNSKRTYTCRLEVPCDIGQISMWNTRTQELITNTIPSAGMNVCFSAQPTLEAKPIFNLGHVDFQLDGKTRSSPSSTYTYYKREWHAPYVMYGNAGSYYAGSKDFTGADLPVGNYTVRIYVRDIANSKIVKFNVTDC